MISIALTLACHSLWPVLKVYLNNTPGQPRLLAACCCCWAGMGCCSKIAEAEAAVSVNEKKAWGVVIRRAGMAWCATMCNSVEDHSFTIVS